MNDKEIKEINSDPWCYDECDICGNEVWVHSRYIIPIGPTITIVCPRCYFQIKDEAKQEKDAAGEIKNNKESPS